MDREAMYLYRRGSHWWIRKAVPVDLVEVLGLTQLRRSLRTRDAGVARRRALQLLVRVDDVFAVLHSERPLRPTKEIAIALLREALGQNFGLPHTFQRKAELIERAEGAILDFLTEEKDPHSYQFADQLDDNDHMGPMLAKREHVMSALTSGRPRAEENHAAVVFLQAVDQLASADLRKVANGHQRVVAAVRSSILPGPTRSDVFHDIKSELQAMLDSAIAELKQRPPPAAPALDVSTIVEAITQAQHTRWSDELLSAAIKRYMVEVVDNSDAGLKHKEDVEQRLSTFLIFVTDKPVRDITIEDLKDYRNHLDKLPVRAELRFKTYDVRKAIEKNSARKEPFPTISPITVDLKYLGPVRRLLEWLNTDRKIENNPAANIHSLEPEKEDAKRKRFPLKPDQISRLFASTARASRANALYWLPPLMLFTGARINELAQLRTSDLRLYNQRLHLSVVCDEDEDEDGDEAPKKSSKKDGQDRSVKTPAGSRLIPVHNELVRIGFLDFLDSRRARLGRDGQLFSDLKPNRFGHWSAAISKRINGRLRSLGILNPRLSAYSLRHNFRDACSAGRVSDEARKKFMGHQLEGMDGVYGNPNPLPHESAEIDLIGFPEVDLTPYQKGRRGASES